jgi:hypothetical protein
MTGALMVRGIRINCRLTTPFPPDYTRPRAKDILRAGTAGTHGDGLREVLGTDIS